MLFKVYPSFREGFYYQVPFPIVCKVMPLRTSAQVKSGMLTGSAANKPRLRRRKIIFYSKIEDLI